VFQAQSSNSYYPYFLQDQFKIMQNEIILYPVIQHLNLGANWPRARATAALPTRSRFQILIRDMLRVESQRSSSLIDINVAG